MTHAAASHSTRRGAPVHPSTTAPRTATRPTWRSTGCHRQCLRTGSASLARGRLGSRSQLWHSSPRAGVASRSSLMTHSTHRTSTPSVFFAYSLQLDPTLTWHTRYLSTDSDMNVLVRGVRLALKLAHTDPVSSKLDLKPRDVHTSSPWWPGVANPNKVCSELPSLPPSAEAVPHGRSRANPFVLCRSQTTRSRRYCAARLNRRGTLCVRSRLLLLLRRTHAPHSLYPSFNNHNPRGNVSHLPQLPTSPCACRRTGLVSADGQVSRGQRRGPEPARARRRWPALRRCVRVPDTGVRPPLRGRRRDG